MRRWVVVDEQYTSAHVKATNAQVTNFILYRLRYDYPDTFQDFKSWTDMMGAYNLHQLSGVYISSMPDLDCLVKIDGATCFTASVEGGIGVYTDHEGCYPWFSSTQPDIAVAYCYNTADSKLDDMVRGGRIH
jgi:hypothetical protein